MRVGHQVVRNVLHGHSGSFALVGPCGVGRAGIVEEWLTDHSLASEQLILTDEGIRSATRRSDLVYVLDGDQVSEWSLLLRPLEEDRFTVVLLSSGYLPPPVTSRIPVYRVGYLSEAEVSQVLATAYPRLQPRRMIARLAHGTLEGIEFQVTVAEMRETMDHALCDWQLPNLTVHDPVALLACLRSACASVLGLSGLPFSTTAKAMISPRRAARMVASPICGQRHEASNALSVFFAAQVR